MRHLCLLTILLAFCRGAWREASAAPHSHAEPAAEVTAVPAGGSTFDMPEDPGASTLAERERKQRAAGAALGVFHDFRFTDREGESGITFVHHAVEDAGRTYKAAHYDHGNGIAAADVDGDGKIDLYFANQIGGSELWKNMGGGRFRNVTAEAGVGLADRVAVSATFADVDNDGDPDLYVTTVRMGNALFENDGKGHFKDISKASGLDYVGHSSSAVFFDYDRDGRLDCFLLNVGKYTTDVRGRGGYFMAFEDAFSGHLKPERTERSVLYRNLGGNRFADVSAATGLQDGSWSGDATITDFNHDGYPDLYVLNMQGDDHYYENDHENDHENAPGSSGGRTFVDKTAQLFPKTSWGAMGVKLFDFDDDGDLDLLVTDMHSDMMREFSPDEEKQKAVPTPAMASFLQGPENNIFGNSFFRNRGDGSFEEVSDALGVENYWPWGVSVGDLNADGWEDVFIASSMNYPFRYGINSLLLNDRGRHFADSEFLLGVEPRPEGKTRQVWFTLDCDSADDKDLKLCAGRSGRLTVMGTLGTRSSVIFDLDGDGDLDIITNEFNAGPRVLISDLAAKRTVRFLQVRLRGTASNRDGLGATVRVVTGKQVQTRFVDGATGYLSHGVLPLYFGLGDATAVDRIEVEWPSGRKQTVEGPIQSGRSMEIVEER